MLGPQSGDGPQESQAQQQEHILALKLAEPQPESLLSLLLVQPWGRHFSQAGKVTPSERLLGVSYFVVYSVNLRQKLLTKQLVRNEEVKLSKNLRRFAMAMIVAMGAYMLRFAAFIAVMMILFAGYQAQQFGLNSVMQSEFIGRLGVAIGSSLFVMVPFSVIFAYAKVRRERSGAA